MGETQAKGNHKVYCLSKAPAIDHVGILTHVNLVVD